MNSKGFTIVELLIVIVIIGILATLVITTIVSIGRKGSTFNYCDAYRFASAADTPVACYSYLTGQQP